MRDPVSSCRRLAGSAQGHCADPGGARVHRRHIHAQRVRRRLCNHIDKALTEVDVIATPTTGCTAPPLLADALLSGESNLSVLDKIIRFVRLPNLTGGPAISFPAGYDESGMPVGLHLIGRPWEEHKQLRIAATAETLLARSKPEIHYPLLEKTATEAVTT